VRCAIGPTTCRISIALELGYTKSKSKPDIEQGWHFPKQTTLGLIVRTRLNALS